ARGAGHLGGQHHPRALAGARSKPVAQDGFGGAAGFGARRHGVHLGGVEEVDAALGRAVEQGVGRGLVHLLAEGHGAQANGGDVQVAGSKRAGGHGGQTGGGKAPQCRRAGANVQGAARCPGQDKRAAHTMNNCPMYSERFPARTEFVRIRSLDYHVWRWGAAEGSAPPLLLVHGWMDVGASYQFMVDALPEAMVQGRAILAPDWRGFGRTRPPQPTDHYVFADYLADLDRLIDHFSGDQPVDLVGHSMGGNIAMLYAGARPARVRRLVNLEGFGLPASPPEAAVRRYAQWMDELARLERGEMALKSYDSLEGVAGRLMKTNPRLSQDKADWLARHWAAQDESG